MQYKNLSISFFLKMSTGTERIEVDKNFIKQLCSKIVYYENKVFLLNQQLVLVTSLLNWVYWCCEFIFAFKFIFNPVPLPPQLFIYINKLVALPNEMFLYFSKTFDAFQKNFATVINKKINNEDGEGVFTLKPFENFQEFFKPTDYELLMNTVNSIYFEELLQKFSTPPDSFPDYLGEIKKFFNTDFDNRFKEFLKSNDINFSTNNLKYYFINSSILSEFVNLLFKINPNVTSALKLSTSINELKDANSLVRFIHISKLFLEENANCLIGDIDFRVRDIQVFENATVNLLKTEISADRDKILILSSDSDINKIPTDCIFGTNKLNINEYKRLLKAWYDIYNKVFLIEDTTPTSFVFEHSIISGKINSKFSNDPLKKKIFNTFADKENFENQSMLNMYEQNIILKEILIQILLRFNSRDLKLPGNLIDPIVYLSNIIFSKNCK